MSGRTFLPALLLCGLSLQAQESDVVKVPLTDPSRPATLKVSLLHGSITVRGYDGKEVIVERGGKSRSSSSSRRVPEKAKGLRRIDNNRRDLTIEEQGNTVQVSSGHNSEGDIVIQTPRQTSLNLQLTNGGGITVENIEGEIDANVTNGFLTLRNISGSVVVHALNDDITATFDKVTPNKPMSFSSLNGDIDVTLPADTRARMKLKSDNGEIYTDFDLTLESSRAPVEEARSTRGRYRIRMDRTVYGAINGGGPDFQFTSLNGKIYIRKK